MSEVDAYLEKLRAALDVSPTRADEIIAEARTHLRAKAAELETSGLSREEAAQEALASFGEPAQVAGQLTRANGGWRGLSPFRMLAGMAVMFAATLTVMSLASHGGGLDVVWSWLSHRAGLGGSSGGMVIWLVLLAPAALLAGMIGGRRHWWVAVTPAILFLLILPLYVLAMTGRMPLLEVFAYTLVYPSVALLVWGGMGWLGARHAAHKAVRQWAIFVIAPLYAALAAVALRTALNGLTAAFMAITFSEIGIVALLATTRREGRLEAGLLGRCLTALAVLGGVLIVTLVAAGAELLYLTRYRGQLTVLGWAVAATAVTLLVGAIFGYYRLRSARNRMDTLIPE